MYKTTSDTFFIIFMQKIVTKNEIKWAVDFSGDCVMLESESIYHNNERVVGVLLLLYKVAGLQHASLTVFMIRFVWLIR